MYDRVQTFEVLPSSWYITNKQDITIDWKNDRPHMTPNSLEIRWSKWKKRRVIVRPPSRFISSVPVQYSATVSECRWLALSNLWSIIANSSRARSLPLSFFCLTSFDFQCQTDRRKEVHGFFLFSVFSFRINANVTKKENLFLLNMCSPLRWLKVESVLFFSQFFSLFRFELIIFDIVNSDFHWTE